MAFDALWLDGIDNRDFAELHKDIFNLGKKLLSNFAFVVEDYQSLASTAVVEYLQALRKNNFIKYLSVIAVLSRPSVSSEKIDRIVEKHIIGSAEVSSG